MRIWTEESIKAALMEHIAELGRMPKHREMRKGLSQVIQKGRGVLAWATLLGMATPSGRSYRTDKDVKREILALSKKFHGRMPTKSEMGPLGAVVCRRGGIKAWASKLKLPLRGSATHMGHKWEDHEASLFKSLGASVVRQKTKSPFDLLVNGHKVDVKSAHWSNVVSAYVFGGIKQGKDTDFFVLVCVEGSEVKARFIVPSSAARVSTLVITRKTLAGYGKYSDYRDSLDLLV